MKMSKFELAMRLGLEFSEAFNRHDVAAMMRMLSEDCLLESARPAPHGATYVGKEAISRFWQDFFHHFPDARLHIEEAFGFGERCVIRWKQEEQEEGEGLRGVDIFKLREGLIREHLIYVKA